MKSVSEKFPSYYVDESQEDNLLVEKKKLFKFNHIVKPSFRAEGTGNLRLKIYGTKSVYSSVYVHGLQGLKNHESIGARHF